MRWNAFSKANDEGDMNILSRKVMVLAPYTLKVDGRPPFGNKGTKITPTYYPVCRPGQARLELNGTGTCTRLLGGGGGARLVPDLLTYSTAPGRVSPPPPLPRAFFGSEGLRYTNNASRPIHIPYTLDQWAQITECYTILAHKCGCVWVAVWSYMLLWLLFVDVVV